MVKRIGICMHLQENPKKRITTLAAVTSGLLTIVQTGTTIVSYFGNVTASLFALTTVRKFTPR